MIIKLKIRKTKNFSDCKTKRSTANVDVDDLKSFESFDNICREGGSGNNWKKHRKKQYRQVA